MIKNKNHQELLKLFQSHQNIQPNNDWVKKYLGTSKTYFNLKTADKKKLVKDYLKSVNPTFKKFYDLLLSLSLGSSFEELSSIGTILELYPVYRHKLQPEIVGKLFNHVEGWAETDTLCQMAFIAPDLLNNWDNWQELITKFSVDPSVHKRRASLVLLTKPLRDSPDPRFYKLALRNVDKLKLEKDILITKAISWVLRSMIKQHPEVVKEYLEKNKNFLPKIAVREVSTKLLTGKKYINKKRK